MYFFVATPKLNASIKKISELLSPFGALENSTSKLEKINLRFVWMSVL
jgi:hypothetical protein